MARIDHTRHYSSSHSDESDFDRDAEQSAGRKHCAEPAVIEDDIEDFTQSQDDVWPKGSGKAAHLCHRSINSDADSDDDTNRTSKPKPKRRKKNDDCGVGVDGEAPLPKKKRQMSGASAHERQEKRCVCMYAYMHTCERARGCFLRVGDYFLYFSLWVCDKLNCRVKKNVLIKSTRGCVCPCADLLTYIHYRNTYL
jgi:hypothetical protein